MDWSVGEYERAARELEPVALHVVELAGVAAGEMVLDVGCGTGNAALAAADRGARVTGVDPASRLLEVAAARAEAAGLSATFVAGSAEELPLGDGSVDAALSVFGVIFADDGRRAVSELVRVTRPGGRVAVACWFGTGALSEAIATVGRRMVEAGLAPPPAPRAVDWNDPGSVTTAFEAHGAAVDVTEAGHVFTGESPAAYWAGLEEHHPLGVTAGAALRRAGLLDEVRAAAVAELAARNEAPDGFRVTSPYFVVRAELAG